MKQKTDYRVIIAAITGIVILEAIALFKGFDGVLLSTVLVILAGIAGWTLPQLKMK